jgi:hypothetical protein
MSAAARFSDFSSHGTGGVDQVGGGLDVGHVPSGGDHHERDTGS